MNRLFSIAVTLSIAAFIVFNDIEHMRASDRILELQRKVQVLERWANKETRRTNSISKIILKTALEREYGQ